MMDLRTYLRYLAGIKKEVDSHLTYVLHEVRTGSKVAEGLKP